MPVAFVFESDHLDQAAYDGVMKAIGRGPIDAPAAAGIIAHMAGPRAAGGWRVVDVWESEDAANAFYGSAQFQPVMAAADEMGITTTPWPIHRLEVERTIRQAG